MDLGRPVILLNLDDLYESLYDALNQYFMSFGNKKFVDLGLGTHRVKAFVDDAFRYETLNVTHLFNWSLLLKMVSQQLRDMFITSGLSEILFSLFLDIRAILQ